MSALLLEVEYSGKHCALRLVQLAVRVRMHHQRPQLVRGMSRNLGLENSTHSECTRHKAGDCVDYHNERSENAPDHPHHRHGVPPCPLGVLASYGSRHQLADYYMKQHGKSEPAGATNHSKADRRQRAPDARRRSRRTASVFLFDRNIQRGFGGGEERAERHQCYDPHQPGRKATRPAWV